MPPTDRRVRPVAVRALEPYRVWLRYEDGGEGEVDLSHLAGDGVFTAWKDHEFFTAATLPPPAPRTGPASACRRDATGSRCGSHHFSHPDT